MPRPRVLADDLPRDPHPPRREFGRPNLYTKPVAVTVEAVTALARKVLDRVRMKSKAAVRRAVEVAMTTLEVDPERHYPVEVDQLRVRACLKLHDEVVAGIECSIPAGYHNDVTEAVRCLKRKKE